MKRITIALVATLATTLSVRGEIVYVNGPSFQIPAIFGGSSGVDLDGDSVPECGFTSERLLCTADVPSSACVSPCYVGSGPTSQMIVTGSDANVLPLNTRISSAPPLGANWSDLNAGVNLVTYYSSPRNGTQEWRGLLAAAGVGYVGVRFETTDGWHYGWIRVRMPQATIGTNGFPLELAPVVVDWAYETTPDKPILAGEKPIYFVATLAGANEVPPNGSGYSGTGKFALGSFVDGFVLEYHLELDGAFVPTSAGIFGPASREGRPSTLIANLGQGSVTNFPPPINVPVGPNPPGSISWVRSLLIYDGQINLSSNQAVQLARGQIYVHLTSRRFPQGELRGQIWPAMPIQFTATLTGRGEPPRRHGIQFGEAAFTLTGVNLDGSVALNTNIAWNSMGIYASPIAMPRTLVAKLTNVLGVMIPPGGLPGEPGLSGQVLYPASATLTDRQVVQLKSGGFYIKARTSRPPRGEISGRILPVE